LLTTAAAAAASTPTSPTSLTSLLLLLLPHTSCSINAYFTYSVVGFYGTGMITYQQALAAVFIEGWIFILISLSGEPGMFTCCFLVRASVSAYRPSRYGIPASVGAH
jgi:xanthine/uracil/vitamin C permease (AzgA family)